jgi:hypothetical protein
MKPWRIKSRFLMMKKLTEPGYFEDEEIKALEDHDEGQRINAFDAVKVTTNRI